MINTCNKDASILEKKSDVKQVLGAWWRLLRSTTLTHPFFLFCLLTEGLTVYSPKKKGNPLHFPALHLAVSLHYSPYCLLPSSQKKPLPLPSPRPLFSGVLSPPYSWLPSQHRDSEISPKTLPPFPPIQPNSPERCLPLLAILPL